MNQQDYFELYEKYLSGKCTPEERKLLDGYLDEFDLKDIPWDEKIGKREEFEQKIFNKISNRVEKNPFILRKIKIKWMSVAASILLVAFSAGLYLANRHDEKLPLVQHKSVPLKNDILPGGNKALLTLADGSEIVLDSAKNGIVTKQGNAAINKTKNGEVVYNATHAHNPSSNLAVVYNTVSTPRGGEYQVVLSDGTKAWLNAASSLKFPTAFQGKTRSVEITGEVYFEVAKNKNMPFKVLSNGAEIEVLGTHFDVMAYGDEPELKTTLLEGSVKFSKNGSAVLLKPGQQAIATNTSKNIIVQPANMKETMAWRNGYFIFQDENIQSIMRKVARWYDVDVQYQGNMESKEFGGKISRYNNISDLLKTLELTRTIHFKVEGRRVTVMQ